LACLPYKVGATVTTLYAIVDVVVVVVVVVAAAAAADDDDDGDGNVDDVIVEFEAKLRTMRDCLLNLRREYNKLLDERTEYQV